MAVPAKYRAIGDFHEYYSGARTAPCLTIFVGGNHEASNHLWELFYGGWVAPDIYYLGAASVIGIGDVRIAAISGIWQGSDYRKPHSERLPYNRLDVRSIYHVREIDVRRLMRIQNQVDVIVSHDWPRKIEWDGDHQWLFKKKDQFEADSRSGRLGSQAARYLLDYLRPPRWFAAHLHIRYAATVRHDRAEPSEKQEHVDQGPNHPADELSSGGDDQPLRKQPRLDMTDEILVAEMEGDEIKDDEEDEETAKLRAMLPGAFSNSKKRAPKTSGDAKPPIDRQGNIEEIAGARSTVPAPFGKPTQPVLSASNEDDDEIARMRKLLPAAFAKPPAPPSAVIQNEVPPVPATIFNKQTEFLALDKCLPGRRFLELLEISAVNPQDTEGAPAFEESGEAILSYDPEWLAISRMMASEISFNPNPTGTVPSARAHDEYLAKLPEHLEWVQKNIVAQKLLKIPRNFTITAPVYDMNINDPEIPEEYDNPQTQAFCDLIGIENKLKSTAEERAERRARGPRPEVQRFGGREGGGRVGHRGGRDGGRGRGRGRGRGGGGGGGGRGFGSANHTPLGVR